MKSLVFTLALSVLVSVSCSHQRVEFEGKDGIVSNESGEKSLSFSTIWLKNKGDTLDILAIIKNGYDEDITFKKKNVRVSVEGESGASRKFDFSGDLGAGDSEKGLMIFAFARELPREGQATLTFTELKSSDGKKSYPDLKVVLPISD